MGIDPIPLKTCNWNCIYCQLGRTQPLKNERVAFISKKEFLGEIKKVLSLPSSEKIDWITFVGSGEPTLNSLLGWMIQQVKSLTTIPVAVITNGALLYKPQLRKELVHADAVLPSLDAGNAYLYKKINRPWPAITFERYIAGLKSFREIFGGHLWIEVMLIRGLNDDEKSLIEISDILKEINPDQVHISWPVRPPAEAWVKPPEPESILKAKSIFGEKSLSLSSIDEQAEFINEKGLDETILGIIMRHPMHTEELIQGLRHWSEKEVINALEKMEKAGRLKKVYRDKSWFWSVSGTVFPR